MIKAVAFDLGGVLFAEGKAVALKNLEEKYSYDKDIVLKVIKSKESFALRNGLISDKDFWGWAQKQLPENYDAQIIRKEWYDGYVLNKDMFGLLKSLKGKYKIIAFSGNIRERVEYLDKKYNFRKYFDVEVYSFNCHLCKPQKEFVEILIKESNLNPEEIVYIDDSEYDSKEAQQFGIKVLIYQQGQIESLKKSLNGLGIVF